MLLKTLLITAFATVEFAAASSSDTRLGYFDAGRWLMDTNGDTVISVEDGGFGDFGDPGDLPVTGDWDNNGSINVGVYRRSTATFYLDYNGNGRWDGATIDRAYVFGDGSTSTYPGDTPAVGDWNNDGRPDLGVVKGCNIAAFCISLRWNLDFNGDGVWNPAVDLTYDFGNYGDTPVTGDWNGDGRTDIGTYRGGMWFLDNGNGIWNPGVDRLIQDFGEPGDLPVAGDWTGDGTIRIGVFRPSIAFWYLDTNGDGQWDGSSDRTITSYRLAVAIPVVGRWIPSRRYDARLGYFGQGQWRFDSNNNGIYEGAPVDGFIASFGLSADQPFTGDWNNAGTLKAGVFRAGAWHLDYNGNGQWDTIDRTYYFGLASDLPVVGDWNGDGQTDIGVYRQSQATFFLDYNGNGTWDGGDRAYVFGVATDIPVAGDWNGDGRSEIGVYRNGFWILDTNGNGTLDLTDRIINFGGAGDVPLTGDWGGTGRSKAAVYRQGTWFLDSNDGGTFDLADRIVPALGASNDRPFIWGLPVQ